MQKNLLEVLNFKLFCLTLWPKLNKTMKQSLMKSIAAMVCALCGVTAVQAQIQTNAGVQYLQCMQKDMSTDFYDLSNT